MENRTGTMAIIVKDGKYLLTQEPPHKTLANLWRLTGGMLEIGETAQTALERECFEEVKITIEIIKPLDIVKAEDRDIEIQTFLAKWKSGELSPDKSVQNAGWFTVGEIENLNLAKLSREILEKYFATQTDIKL